MSPYLLVAVPAVIAAIHVFALLMSRRSVSSVGNWAFVSGVLGLLSLPAVMIVFVFAMPVPLVGPAKPNLEMAFFACAGAALALTASSVILGLYAASKRTGQPA
ncbi:MAG: hypothetical protein K0M70_08245 [Arenimonas sp.]|uniref:hypothetical protein n=1 Tax=Arenimonas sp. TaxID=1872635 RepID=UPI0025BD39D5|nr:hypothetical protein [Arenimonas sp.]MBW8367832.1 hypothetical protein [Arenimonas sp.]